MKIIRRAPGVTRTALFWLTGFLLTAFIGLTAPAARADTVLSPPIGVGPFPERLAVTPDGKAVYVVNLNGASVSVIDADPASPGFNTLITTFTVDGAPTDVAIAPNGYAYVGRQGQLVNVIDTNPARPTYNTVVATINIPFLGTGSTSQVAITPDGKRAYVTNHTAHTISVIDADPASATWNTVIYTIAAADGLGASADPWGIAIDPNGLAYVADAAGNQVYVIDTNPASSAYNTVVRTYADPNGAHSAAQVAVTPNGRYVYVGHWFVNLVTVIDTVTGAFSNVDVGSASVGLAVTADGGYVYVTAYYADSVKVIDTGSNTVIDSLDVGSGPYGVAINKCYAYVTNSGNDSVSVIERSGNCSGSGSGSGGVVGGGITPVPALNETALALLALLLAGGAAAKAWSRTR